jgi:type II secretory pathway pseudopilin PulG
MRHSSERGIAMITTLLVLMLISALLVGFTAVVMSDQRYRFIDRDRSRAFYAASGAIEKLTADLGNLFFSNVAPTAAQVTALTTTPPTISDVTFTAASTPTPLPGSQLVAAYHCKPPKPTPPVKGTNGYTISYCGDLAGNPTTSDDPIAISTGPFSGLYGLISPYQLDVTAKTATGGEVHLVRTIESVAIPVFQFGIFSDVDLSFFAESNFGFGGRVHTNGNLFLAEGQGATLTINDKITALKEVVRQNLSNGVTLAAVAMDGTVKLASSGTTFRNLAATEGSVTGNPAGTWFQPIWSSPYNEPTWHSISLSTYNSYIRNGRTGAKALNLPLITVGGATVDLIKRPIVNEDTSNAVLFNERLFSKASLRILLSDTAADITNLPTVTAAAPVLLDGNWTTAPPAGYGPVDLTHPPVALSTGPISAAVSGTASTTSTINVVSSTPFRPLITVVGTLATVNVTCTGKTATTFTNCTPVAPAVTIPAAVSGASITGAPGISTTTTAAITAGAGPMTISVVSAANFVPLPFWFGGPSPAADVGKLVTCTSWTATSFTTCTGLPSAPTTSGATLTSASMSNAGIGLLGGYIKIEKQDTTGVWTDVTTQILNYGIGGPNLSGTACADPTPNAILRLQRLRDNNSACNYNTVATGIKEPTNWWPNVLFDAREAVQRDADPGNGTTGLPLGGGMYYIALDVANLAKWFTAVAPFNTGTGAGSKTDNTGYTVYFSDRRNNRNAASVETGEFGWEDFVNPGVATGAPNGTLDGGEDVNASGALDLYGAEPNYNGTYNTVPPCAACAAGYALNSNATPVTIVPRATAQFQVNRPILFRRALKLLNGATIAPTLTGLTVVSENPVYIHGDWNAASTWLVGDTHAATAIIADAVTVLSNSWNDNNSFASPYLGTGRLRAANSYYRVAIISGKGIGFQRPSDVAASSVFGTDGGAHNFLRMLEGDNGTTTTVHYRGSMASFFYNRQAVGTFKCCSGTLADGIVYSVPIRDFIFDVDFLNPAKLPPNTPMFRDMNAVGFSQDLRPGK